MSEEEPKTENHVINQSLDEVKHWLTRFHKVVHNPTERMKSVYNDALITHFVYAVESYFKLFRLTLEHFGKKPHFERDVLQELVLQKLLADDMPWLPIMGDWNTLKKEKSGPAYEKSLGNMPQNLAFMEESYALFRQRLAKKISVMSNSFPF